jgi:hypothetical protein
MILVHKIHWDVQFVILAIPRFVMISLKVPKSLKETLYVLTQTILMYFRHLLIAARLPLSII